MKSYALPVLAVLSLTFAVSWTLAERPVRKSVAPPAPPPETTSASTVAAVGLVEPETENIALSCAVSGLVTSLDVKAGDRVRAGQKLFSIDNRDLAADLAVKRAALENARAQLAKLTAAPRPEEVPPAEAKVAEARAQVEDAEVQVRLIESVTDSRAVKREDVLRRRLAYQAAQARLAQAEKDLALLKAGTWAPDLAIARAQVEQAEAAVRQDEVNLERLTVRAPMDGLILQNKVRLGQYAQCGPLSEPLMIFGGGRDLHVRADIDEEDSWRVKPGQPALAHVRGDSRTKYALEFVRFEPHVIAKQSLTGAATERVDTRVLQAIYRFRDRDAHVFNGQQMDVFIEAPAARAAATQGGMQ
ncbi:MAG TPA: HlyD family efflux transporter periplasmic adaptor subunit [Bryobacteraceae bacterium]|nr:HlyD family efflux transporter periplasmic adaptor subunit [Bryobacteraceae bacterium]